MVIYKITNKINNKVYIGQTIQDVSKRWNCHKHLSRNLNYKQSSIIHKAIAKYGEVNFTFEIINSTANNIEELNKLEIEYIKKFNSLLPNGYNVQYGGSNCSHDEKTKEKMRRAKHNPVDCKCLDTGVTYSFYNIKESAEMGFVPASVASALYNGNRVSKNFYWKKRNEEFPDCVKTWYKNKVYNYKLEGKETSQQIMENIKNDRSKVRHRSDGTPIVDHKGIYYKSIAEAARVNNTYHAGIRAVLRKERKTASGCKFRYATEEEILQNE